MGRHQGDAGIYFSLKAYAYLQRRNYVIPEDIKYLAYDILRHRPTFFAAEAESMTADKIIKQYWGMLVP